MKHSEGVAKKKYTLGHLTTMGPFLMAPSPDRTETHKDSNDARIARHRIESRSMNAPSRADPICVLHNTHTTCMQSCIRCSIGADLQISPQEDARPAHRGRPDGRPEGAPGRPGICALTRRPTPARPPQSRRVWAGTPGYSHSSRAMHRRVQQWHWPVEP